MDSKTTHYFIGPKIQVEANSFKVIHFANAPGPCNEEFYAMMKTMMVRVDDGDGR